MFNFIKKLFSKPDEAPLQNTVKEVILPVTPPESYSKELTELDKSVLTALEVAYEKPITEKLYGDKLDILAAIAAISSVISSVKWELDNKVQFAIYDALFSYFKTNDYFSALQKIEEQLLGEKFEWELYDNCVESCEELQLYPYYYKYLKRRPKTPQSIKEAVSLLTVNHMRAVLKRKGLVNLPRIKESVIELFVHSCTLEDCQAEVKERLELAKEKFEYQIRKEKINALLLTTIARKDAIINHYICSIREEEPINPILKHKEFSLVRANFEDGEEFYKAVYRDNPRILENGEIISLPPYYPADNSYIDYYGNEL